MSPVGEFSRGYYANKLYKSIQNNVSDEVAGIAQSA
jgi:hypothetical protein